MTAGMAVASCMKKAWPPSYSASWAPGMARARNSLLAGGAIPSNRPPQTKVGHAMSPRRPAVSCSARAASWLARPGGAPRPPRRGPSARRSARPCRGWPGARPRPTGCRGAPSDGRPLLGTELDELLERVGAPPPRRRRCRRARASAPAPGAGWPAPGPPCPRMRRRRPGSPPSPRHRGAWRRRRRNPPWRRATPARCCGPGRAGRRRGPRRSRRGGHRSGGAGAVGLPRCPRCTGAAPPRPFELVVERDVAGRGPGHGSRVPTGRRPRGWTPTSHRSEPGRRLHAEMG